MRTPMILIAALLSTPAAAVDYCVGNGDELQSAMTTAANTAASDQIRLRAGVYQRTLDSAPGEAAMFIYESQQSGSLVLSGGWNAGCTVRSLNPLASVLFGQNQHRVLEIRTFGQSTASIVVYNLGLAGGFSNSNQGAALGRFDLFSSGGSVLDVTHVDFSGGEAINSPAVSMQTSTGRISFWNNVVHFNESSAQHLVSVAAAEGTTIDVTNNTITQNASGPFNAVALQGLGTVQLYNNVLWGNASAFDVSRTQTLTLDARANHIGMPSSSMAGALDTTSGDPLLVNPSGSDHRPRAGSPLRNSGVASPPGGAPTQDYAGIPRNAGGRIDRGAFEFDELLVDGFE